MTRFSITVVPLEDGNVKLTLEAHAADVTRAEIVCALAKAGGLLAQAPNALIPTVTEVKAAAARAKVLQDHPAVTLYARDGDTLVLGEATGNHPGFVSMVESLGWARVGPVPKALQAPDDVLLEIAVAPSDAELGPLARAWLSLSN